MTTTEWVERYNQAFDQADWSARFWDRRHRGGYPSWDKLIDLVHAPAMKSYTAKDWFLNVVGRGDIALVAIPESERLPQHGEKVLIDGKERTISSVEVMKDNFGRRTYVGLVCRPLPSNPSPFEPKEVVDDGPAGQNALNQKERLFWPVTGKDFAKSIAWSKTEVNPVAEAIKESVVKSP
jgi:hypothetical protein